MAKIILLKSKREEEQKAAAKQKAEALAKLAASAK